MSHHIIIIKHPKIDQTMNTDNTATETMKSAVVAANGPSYLVAGLEYVSNGGTNPGATMGQGELVTFQNPDLSLTWDSCTGDITTIIDDLDPDTDGALIAALTTLRDG